ncbi:glycosyltransferase [Paenibacillus sp. LMG 31459]|uniref:Glycosyltransferase n=1 Tax=Paenibacillus phytohabitans TaxID=2654978 RepID=A0ABX1YFW7_9BACL|nr:glycosyltransferase [Paenibacillus phytohabitans]NOU79239.1 glycosyltransferase [Paenibacillus phytohabitans]
MQKASIIIAVFPNQFEYMKASIDSIRRFTTKGSYELIVVESGSCLETRNWLAEETEIRSLFFEEQLSLSIALNEGMKVSKYDSILIMHEDTLVTENWLELLLDELYKNSKTGAVGPLTNFADDDQAEAVQFASMEELLAYARGLSKTNIVEERMTLSDFCFLFKRSVLETTGLLDEQLNGHTAIIDFGLRIIEHGYTLALCRHAYVHHYGINEVSTDKIHQRRFKIKWGFNCEAVKVESNIFRFLEIQNENIYKILILGLVKGKNATTLKIKQMYPDVEIKYCDIEQLSQLNRIEKFDYIILSSLVDPEHNLSDVKEMLAKHGQLIIEFSNINFVGVIKRLLLGEGLDADKRYWNLVDIGALFEEAGFQELDFEYVYNDTLQEQDDLFIQGLGDLVEKLPQVFEISSFLVSARMISKNGMLHELFSKLLQASNEETVSSILRFKTIQIVSALDSYAGPVVPLLNYLGISNLERRNMDDIIPYLSRAYELESDNSTTLINLATVMHSVGEDEQALGWLESIGDKSEHVSKWVRELKQTIFDKKLAKSKIKFLLRRIENNVEREASSMELIALLQQNEVSTNQIIESVMADIVDKIGTLNRVAINCFNSGLYEVVIPLLEKSHIVEPENEDTLFNLGYILFKFGAYNEALDFLMKIREPDEDVLSLQRDIEGSKNHGYK